MLFDGVCNLCNATVNFIIDRDPGHHFRFASLQSDAGKELLRAHGVTPQESGDPDSILLVQGDRVLERSTAALHIARGLAGGWKLLYLFIVVPRFVRDVVYRFIARHRYRWFGKSDTCRVPTPELRARFL